MAAIRTLRVPDAKNAALILAPLRQAVDPYENEPKSATLFKRFLVCHAAILFCSSLYCTEPLSRAPLGADELVDATTCHFFDYSFANHMAYLCSNGCKLGPIQKDPQVHTNRGSSDRTYKPRALGLSHYPFNLDVARDYPRSTACDLSSRESSRRTGGLITSLGRRTRETHRFV